MVAALNFFASACRFRKFRSSPFHQTARPDGPTIEETKMKYIALIYMDPTTRTPPDSPEFGKMMAGYGEATATYKNDGVWVAGDALQPVTTATTVRVKNGKTETMDGPFAETKEQLGGYYIFDCADLDAAIKYAAMIPHAAMGAVEVRPIMVFNS
jgi:hypothetical protein